MSLTVNGANRKRGELNFFDRPVGRSPGRLNALFRRRSRKTSTSSCELHASLSHGNEPDKPHAIELKPTARRPCPHNGRGDGNHSRGANQQPESHARL
jgi:hypothetical protein